MTDLATLGCFEIHRSSGRLGVRDYLPSLPKCIPPEQKHLDKQMLFLLMSLTHRVARLEALLVTLFVFLAVMLLARSG
jgi:hypothetical protein